MRDSATDLNVSHDFAPDFNYPSRAGYQIADATRPPRGFPWLGKCDGLGARAREITKFRDSFIGQRATPSGGGRLNRIIPSVDNKVASAVVFPCRDGDFSPL